MRESVLDIHLAEVLLLDLVSGELLASATGASIVFVAGTRRLNHKQTETLQVIMCSKSHGSAEGALTGVDSVHLDLHAKSLSENRPWNLDAEHLFVLLSLLSCSVHQ